MGFDFKRTNGNLILTVTQGGKICAVYQITDSKNAKRTLTRLANNQAGFI